jgi:hypothetical protein
MYEPGESIAPYVTRYWNSNHVFDLSLQSKRARGRKGKQQEKEHNAQLEELISESLSDLVEEKWRVLYELRLRRQAALLRFAERDQDADLACAVAAALHPSSSIPPQEQPFLRAMIHLSIEQGPLRLMVESLGSGNLSAMPISLFSEE